MDIFGKALLDYHADRRETLLTIRRDDDHTDTHDPGLYFTPDPFAHEAALLHLIQGPVLDIGCGAGRTVAWLEQRDIPVTGIDLSPGAVEVCRARGFRDVRQVDAMDGLATKLDGDSFETAILFGNNVGIGGTKEGAARLLANLARVVRPGGQMLVTGLNIARTDAPAHLAYHVGNLAFGRPRGEITMRFEYRGEIGDWVPWFHPEPLELQDLAAAAGWAVEDLSIPDGPFYRARLRRAV